MESLSVSQLLAAQVVGLGLVVSAASLPEGWQGSYTRGLELPSELCHSDWGYCSKQLVQAGFRGGIPSSLSSLSFLLVRSAATWPDIHNAFEAKG